MERVAAGETPDGQPGTLERAVSAYCFESILGA
jgi:hypothetical protein